MQSEILNVIKTREDQRLVLEELTTLLDSLYKMGANDWETTLNSRLKTDLAVIIRTETYDAVIDKKKYLREIIDCVKSMKIMKVTLAINPTQTLVNKITNWIKQSIGAGIIIEIEVNRNIIGGIRIAYEGRYGDFSVYKKWQDTWNNQGKEFLEKLGYG